MGAEPIQCVCPKCKANYRVPPSALGHRARCTACASVFQIVERLRLPPSEDDILRWLREAEEHDDLMAETEAEAVESSSDETACAEAAHPDDTDAGGTNRVIPIQSGRHPGPSASPVRIKTA